MVLKWSFRDEWGFSQRRAVTLFELVWRELTYWRGVGAASGVLSKPLGAAIIIMVILTTFIAPPLLRLVFPDPKTVTTNSNQLILDGASQTSAIAPTSIDLANQEKTPDSHQS